MVFSDGRFLGQILFGLTALVWSNKLVQSQNAEILKYHVNVICKILFRKSLNGILLRFIRIFMTQSGRWMILDIFKTSEDDERPPMAKRMDTFAQFSRDQQPRMIRNGNIVVNFPRKRVIAVATPDPWN